MTSHKSHLRLNRKASRLLSETYTALQNQSGEGYIQPTLLEIWENSGSGAPVAAEALVALELAAKDVALTHSLAKRISFARLEDTEPDLMGPLFEAAIVITETRHGQKARTS